MSPTRRGLPSGRWQLDLGVVAPVSEYLAGHPFAPVELAVARAHTEVNPLHGWWYPFATVTIR